MISILLEKQSYGASKLIGS